MQIISRQEAKAQGLKYYFTGEPCCHGHIALRRVASRYCKTCETLRKIQWVKNNRMKLNAKIKERYALSAEVRRKVKEKNAVCNKRYKLIGPLNPKDQNQWLKRAQRLSKTIKRIPKLSSHDLFLLQKLASQM